MAERSNCFVHTEGDIGDVLFELPYYGRSLREDDTITVTMNGQSAVTYKVESVAYHLIEDVRTANPNNIHKYWTTQEIHYGVSIVP